MIITFFRSSSYNGWDFCQHKYFIEYVLGLKYHSNKKAEIGTIVHKALELLAIYKLNKERGIRTFEDDALGHVHTDDCTPEYALDSAFHYYACRSPHSYTDKDNKECHRLMNIALEYKEGIYNPQNLPILECEKVFDIGIKKDWAKYKFEVPNGQIIEGYLGLKGTIDVINAPDDDSIEILDWKTGIRKNWATNKRKEQHHFETDPQLLIYYYALRNTYVDRKHFMATIFYLKDGGPFTVCFDDYHYELAEKLLKNRFRSIKANQRPKLIKYDKKQYHKCGFCEYNKNNLEGSEINVCKEIQQSIRRTNLLETMKKYGKTDSYLHYGEGGGRGK